MKLIVIILATLVAQGYSQRYCYICNNCNDPFDTSGHDRVRCTADNIFQPPVEETPPPAETTTPPLNTPTTTTGPVTQSTDSQPPSDTPPGPPSETPTTTLFPPTPAGLPPQGLLRRRRNISPINEVQDPTQNEAFRCFIAHRDVGGEVQTQRGCTAYIGEATCALLGVAGDNCRICDSDGCNSGARFTLSILTLITALFIAIRLH
uniref:Uncharacterized protein n=1 Tax=Phlebotomus papatasi TaxID=29031 RepID=A0A1B0CYG5_PHLPP